MRLACDIGALGALPPALIYAGGVHIHYGDFAEAARVIDEADVLLAAATGHASHKYCRWSWPPGGLRRSRLRDHRAVPAAGRPTGRVSLLGTMGYVQGVLYNGLARLRGGPGGRAYRPSSTTGFNSVGLSLIEHVEAATRCGELDQARASPLSG